MKIDKLHYIWCNAKTSKYIDIDMDDRLAILPLENKKSYIILNNMSKKIWRNFKISKSLNEFISDLLKDYKVEKDVLVDDIYNFFKILFNEKLLYLESENIIFNDNNTESYQNYIEPYLNIKYDNYNYKQVYGHYSKHQKPFKVFLELTYNCNLRCKHCYLGDETNEKSEILDFNTIKKLINELKESGVVELVITGGEASIHPDFLKILQYATSKKFVVTLLTNGTYLNDDIINELSKMDLYDVKISIYGFKEYHDNFVGLKGAFDKSVNALSELTKKANIGTAVCVINKENFHLINELKSFFNDHKVDMEVSPIIFPTIYGDLQPTSLRMEYEQYQQFIKDTKVKLGGNRCSGGISRFRITPSGDVNPCEMLRNIYLGNIKEKSFDEILSSNERKDWIKTFKRISSEKKCDSCLKKKYCINCLGISYLETGNLYGISEFACNLADLQCKIND